MIRDPFHNQIVKKLNELLGAEAGDPFERCACDVLREIYPTLVPISGGGDSGKDGSIAQNGEINLVCTVQDSVTTNVKKSLDSYISDGGTAIRVIVATPRILTPRKRRNLENAVQEKGFQLIQIHDRDSFANLLYSNSRWCKELLGLSGAPQSLSIFPKTTRPFFDISLVGRDDEINILKENEKDLILVGQPGSGKTSVLFQLVKENDALFVVNCDSAEIVNEIRDKKPKILIADDSHAYKDVLTTILHVRSELDINFKIVASAWPSASQEIQDIMGLANNDVVELALLSLDQIVDVIKECDIYGPNDLIREINHQSRGKPGLAVTLCHLIKTGGVQDVSFGEALARNIKHSFEPFVGKSTTQIIAAFSLGGDSGFTIKDIAVSLGLSVSEVQYTVVHLASGGVLEEKQEKRLAVYPARLRQVLIRDMYFSGAASLSPDDLISKATNRESTVVSIICAKILGGNIDDEFLKGLVNSVPTGEVCEVYCSIGENETEWILDKFPHHLNKIIRTGLHSAPNIVIPKLLDESPPDINHLHSRPSEKLRKLQDWCWSGYPGRDAVARRRALLEEILKWHDDSKDRIVTFKALQICMHPGYEGTDTDPGSGMKFTISRAHITLDDLKKCFSWWSDIFGMIKSISISSLGSIWELVDDWAYPGRHSLGNSTEKEFSAFSKEAATKMLTDICSLYPNHNGIKQKVNSIANHANLNITLEVDKEFDALFPIEKLEDYEATEREHKNNTDKIVSKWAGETPDIVAGKIKLITEEAKETGLNYPDYTDYVCRGISNKVDTPLDWFHAFNEADIDPRYSSMFLESLDINNDKTQKIIKEWLSKTDTKYFALRILLDNPDAPSFLFKDAIPSIESYYADNIAFHKKILPEGFVVALLSHEKPEIRCAAAIQEWRVNNTKPRASLLSKWKSVITDAESNNIHIKNIFKHEPDLGCAWLKNKVRGEKYIYDTDTLVNEVLKIINDEHRQEIIKSLDKENSHFNEEFIKSIVNNNKHNYEILLNEPLDIYQHLSPLKGIPTNSQDWLDMVKLAVSKGYTHEEIAFAINGWSHSWEGPTSEYHKNWEEGFQNLMQNKNDDIRKIGEIGMERAKKDRLSALEKEKKENIYGRS